MVSDGDQVGSFGQTMLAAVLAAAATVVAHLRAHRSQLRQPAGVLYLNQ